MPAWLTVSWFLSKFWEWGDTALLVARNKPVRRVHFVHHMITPSLVALQFVGRLSQTPLFEVGTALNAFVHVWMYAYFAYPKRWSPLWRALITHLQVAQHVAMCLMILYTVVEGDAECDRDVSHNVAPLLVYTLFVVEFSRLLTSRTRDMLMTASGLSAFVLLGLRSSSSVTTRTLCFFVVGQGIACHGDAFPGACMVDRVMNAAYCAYVNWHATSRLTPCLTIVSIVAYAFVVRYRHLEVAWVVHVLLVQVALSVALRVSGV